MTARSIAWLRSYELSSHQSRMGRDDALPTTGEATAVLDEEERARIMAAFADWWRTTHAS